MSTPSAVLALRHVPEHPASDAVRSRLRRLPPLRYGGLPLASRYLLSPLAGYTNLAFRRIVREIGGVGLCTTDLVNARGLLAGSRRSLQLIETCPDDHPLAVQIFGNDAAALRDAAQFLEARGIPTVDINMGCPVERITKNGAGSRMMCSPAETVRLVQTVVEAVRIPVTVKMRLGWDERQITAPRFAREFEQVGVAAVAIHGRTRAQGFKGTVDRRGIRRVVEAVQRIPVIANGDIRTVEDAIAMFHETGAPAVSIGRGALANPWIFSQLCEWERTGRYSAAGNFMQRLELLKRQLHYLVERRGERVAVIDFRKMAHWYLKSMRVRAWLRNRFQQAQSLGEIDSVLREIVREGPVRGSRTGPLPQIRIPVPSGPVERW
ncbi:MAG: tRNA dihydrouridine synthase DusB [Planctomycetota bacterium]|nr:MAG: tRNA dihydrouridine synthase DusB [Planctomycetota bacterium]